MAGRYLQDNLITSIERGAFEGLGKLYYLCVKQPTLVAPRADGSVMWCKGVGLALRVHAACDCLAAVRLGLCGIAMAPRLGLQKPRLHRAIGRSCEATHPTNQSAPH